VLSFQAGKPYLATMLTRADGLIVFFRQPGGHLLIHRNVIHMAFAEEKRSGTMELLFTFPLTIGRSLGGNFSRLALYTLLWHYVAL